MKLLFRRNKLPKDRPGGAILLWIALGMVALGVALPSPAGAKDAPGRAVSFTLPDAIRLLGDLEQCREQAGEVVVLRALNEKANELEGVRKEREELLRERIAFLEAQNAELIRMNEQALKMAEQTRKAAGGAWYEKMIEAGKYLAIGIVIGLATGR